MMPADVTELNNFLTEIEDLLRRHNVPAALIKCNEAKTYITLLSGVVARPTYTTTKPFAGEWMRLNKWKKTP